MKSSVLLAGIAVLALAGTAAWAADNVHTMTVRLPGGGVEHITYTGDVAPKIVVAPNAAAMPRIGFMPMMFPDMARMQAEMVAHMAQMHAMIEHANAMAARAAASAPNGTMSISTNGGGAHSFFCAHSVQITTDAHGKQNVVEHTAGNCGGSNSGQTSAPANHPAPAKGTPI